MNEIHLNVRIRREDDSTAGSMWFFFNDEAKSDRNVNNVMNLSVNKQ